MKRFIKWLIIGLLTFGSFGFLYYTFKLNVLEIKYFICLSMIVILFWLFIIIKLLYSKSKLITKILLCVISLFLIAIYGLGARYFDKTIEFMKKITNAKYETINYKVLTLNTNGYETLSDINKKTIGFMSTDNYLVKSTTKLEKMVDFTNNTYEEIGSLIGALYENKIDALVINESYLCLLEENNVDFIKEYNDLYDYSIKVSNKNIKTKKNVTKEPFVVYISGSDSRGSISEVSRSDVNIVSVINPSERKILLISIPRDYYVQLHGTTGVKDKLTHAGIYGIKMSSETIEDLLDIDINYYLKVSFSTVEKVVDTIDGIDIYSDTEFSATSLSGNKCNYIVGNQHLNGECALRFARERKIYISGDRHRGQNQQAVITSIINKMSNPKYLIKYDKILNNINGTMETNLTYDEIVSMAKFELSDLKKWNVESISLDGEGAMLPTYSMGDINLYVMIPDENTINNAKNKIDEYLR